MRPIFILDSIEFFDIFPYSYYLEPGAYWWSKDGGWKELVEVWWKDKRTNELVALKMCGQKARQPIEYGGYWSSRLR